MMTRMSRLSLIPDRPRASGGFARSNTGNWPQSFGRFMVQSDERAQDRYGAGTLRQDRIYSSGLDTQAQEAPA